MWVRFNERFDWIQSAASTVVFRPDGGPSKDGHYPVTRECAAAAEKAGVAVPVPKPRRLR